MGQRDIKKNQDDYCRPIPFSRCCTFLCYTTLKQRPIWVFITVGWWEVSCSLLRACEEFYFILKQIYKHLPPSYLPGFPAGNAHLLLNIADSWAVSREDINQTKIFLKTYYQFSIGREEACSIGFDRFILFAEAKLNCKPIKLRRKEEEETDYENSSGVKKNKTFPVFNPEFTTTHPWFNGIVCSSPLILLYWDERV